MARRKAEPPAPVYLTKSDLARRHLQEMIVSGAVRPGQRITPRELGKALGMSDTPIREAIRSLAAEGWLRVNPHLGVVVASVSAEHLREIFALRGSLGALAIRLGAADFTPARLAAIDRNLDRAAGAVAAGDATLYARLNREFHLLLSDTPRTQWTLRLLASVWAQTTAMLRGFEMVPDRLGESLAEHRAIRAALGAGDPDRAAALLAGHEHRAGDVLIAALRGAEET